MGQWLGKSNVSALGKSDESVVSEGREGKKKIKGESELLWKIWVSWRKRENKKGEVED